MRYEARREGTAHSDGVWFGLATAGPRLTLNAEPLGARRGCAQRRRSAWQPWLPGRTSGRHAEADYPMFGHVYGANADLIIKETPRP
jgi:hypothetical protein